MSYIKKYAAFPIVELESRELNLGGDWDESFKIGGFIVMECSLKKEIIKYEDDSTKFKYYEVGFPYEQTEKYGHNCIKKIDKYSYKKSNLIYTKEIFDTYEQAEEYITYLREISKDYNRRKDEIYKAANTVSKYNHGYEIEKSNYTNEYYELLQEAVDNKEQLKYFYEIIRKLEVQNKEIYAKK